MDTPTDPKLEEIAREVAKWKVFDVGGIGVRDIQTPLGRIIDVPADKAVLIAEFANTSLSRVTENAEKEKAELNQCMGCQAGWPMVGNSMHRVIDGYPGEVCGCNKARYLAKPSPDVSAGNEDSREGQNAPAVDSRELAEWLKPQCSRLLHGFCSTRRCLLRGGALRQDGKLIEAVDYSKATCEPYELSRVVTQGEVGPQV